jgi:hypothetical protein
MPHMTEHGAIGLVQLLPHLLANGGVGFGEIERYQPIFVTGLDVGDNVECQRRGVVDRTGIFDRQAKPGQSVDQPALGFLEFEPSLDIAG